MITYNEIKMYYHNNLWEITWVKNAVKKSVITADQYFLITGVTYKE